MENKVHFGALMLGGFLQEIFLLMVLRALYAQFTTTQALGTLDCKQDAAIVLVSKQWPYKDYKVCRNQGLTLVHNVQRATGEEYFSWT